MTGYPGYDDDLNACAALVERGDPDRFRALLTAPLRARERLLPLYAFNLEVARAPWVVQEPMLGQIRLKWWEEAVDEIATDAPARAHEIVRPLARLVQDAGLPIADLHSIIAARHWDIEGTPFSSTDDLLAHIAAGSGSLTALGAAALGATGDVLDAARNVGTRQGVAAWLVGVAAMAGHGLHPLPDDSDDAIREVAGAGLRLLTSERHRNFSTATPALRAGWQAVGLLKLARRNPALVRDGGLELSEFTRRGSLLYKTAIGGW